MTIARGEWAQAVVTRARERFAVRRAALFWRDPAGTLSCIASAGPGGGADWVGKVLPAGVGAASRAVAEGRPFWSPDLLADPRIPMADWLRERLEREGLRSVVAAPLRKGGAALGALGLLDEARTYGEADLAGLAAFADEAALDAPSDPSG
jgi:GAF domain-containing protein